MRASVFAAALFAVLLVGVESAHAQVQVRNSLSGYVDFGVRLQSANRFFLADGSTIDQNDLSITTLPLYAEFGIIDRWLMLTYSADLYRRNRLEEEAATTGLGDMRLGLWTTVLDSKLPLGPVRVLAAAHLGIPTGDPYPEGDNFDTDATALLLPTGDGEWDVELSVSGTWQLQVEGYPLRHYFVTRLGYWIRTTPRAPEEGSTAEIFFPDPGKIGDGFTYWFEAGTQVPFGFLDRLWLTVTLNGVESFTDAENADNLAGGIGLGDGVTYTVLGGQASYELPAGFGLGARVEGPLSGALILDSIAGRFFASFQF